MDSTKPLIFLMRSAAAALCLFAMAQPALAQDAAKDAPKSPRKDLALKGDAVCTRCHGVDDEYPVLAIGRTKHGTVADKRTPTCVSCHGASETHVNRPPDAKERPKPTITYGLPPIRNDALPVDVYFGVRGKATETPATDRNAACLSCHQGGKRMHWQTSMHSTRNSARRSAGHHATRYPKAR
jgi:cytochrome c553